LFVTFAPILLINHLSKRPIIKCIKISFIYFSISGVSDEAKQAIIQGKQPTFFVMHGYDLTMVLSEDIGLIEFLRRRRRLTPINIVGAIWKTIVWFGSLFVIKINLPIWGIILLMFAISLLIGVIFFLHRTSFTETYLAYTPDTFFGISWHWSYDGGTVYDVNILPRCPSCKTLLQPSNIVVNEFTLVCSHSGFQKEFEYSYDELLN